MARRVELRGLIEGQKVGSFQMAVLGMCFAVLVIDGFDAQAIGYVAPLLIRHLHVARSAFGPIFGAGLFGVLLGSLILGLLADRFGRKPVILAGLTLFGVCTLATAFVGSVGQLTILRFVTGVGLGGAMPNALALMSEYAPRRSRTLLATIMLCGFPVGAALGGLLAAKLIVVFGWPSVFYFGGVLPLACLPILFFGLPESLPFLVLHGRRSNEIRPILERIDSAFTFPPETTFAVDEPHLDGFPVRHLFTQGRALFTILLWCAFGMNLMVLYFVSSWMPTVISSAGLTVTEAVTATSLFQVGGTVGALMLGRFVDRLGPYALVVTYACAPVLLVLLGFTASSPACLMVVLTAAGFCVVGGQTGTNAFTGAAYPTAIRSTGAGWALGIGRVGSIAGSLIGGVLIGLNWSIGSLFLAVAVPSCMAALSLYFAVRLQPEQMDTVAAVYTATATSLGAA